MSIIKPVAYFLTIILSVASYAYTSNPEKGSLFIRNYTASEYQGHIQNWSIVQDNRGLIYVANKAVILEYDGSGWRKYPTVKQASTVRSIAVDPKTNRIYAGSINEIGYLASNNQGEMQYHSLMSLLDSAYHNFTDVWKTYIIDDKVYFCSTQLIIRYCTKTLSIDKVFETPYGSFHLSFETNNKLYVRIHNSGLHVLKKDTLVPIQNGSFYKNEAIFSIIPFDANSFYTVGRQRGVYFYNGKEFIKPKGFEKVDAFLIDNNVYHGIKLSDGNMAFATVLGGIIICTPKGDIIRIVDKESGLQENTVLYLFEDQQNNLWASLYRGISMVEYNSPWEFWAEDSGLNGVVESMVRHDETLYAATSFGVFYLDGNRFKKVDNIESQTWDLLEVSIPGSNNKILLAANFDGFYKIVNNKAILLKKILHCYSLVESNIYPGLVFLGMNEGIEAFAVEQNGIKSLGLLNNFNITARRITQDSYGNIWVGTIIDGLHKISIEKKDYAITSYKRVLESISVTPYDRSFGLQSREEIKPFYINQSLFAATYNGLFLYDKENDIFISDTIWRPFFINQDAYVSRIFKDHSGNVWIEADRKYLFIKKDNKYVDQSQAFQRLPQINTFAFLSEKPGHTWLGGTEGIFRYKKDHSKDFEKSFNAIIRSVAIDNDSLIFRGNRPYTLFKLDATRIDYSNNSVLFTFAAPFFEKSDWQFFSYKLEGFDKEWSQWSRENRKEYTNLSAGRYSFKVRALNVYGIVSREDSYEFVITPPWYLTKWVIVIFIFAGFAIIYTVVALYGWRLQSKNRMLNKLVKERTKEIQKASKELEKLSIVASETENAITIFNSNGYIEWANDSFTKIYGYSIEEYKKSFGSTIFESSHNKDIKNLIEYGIANKQAVTYDYSAITKSGKEIWIQTTLSPIYNGNKLDKLVAIDTDITKLKEVQKNLQTKSAEIFEINKLLLKQKEDLQIVQKNLSSTNNMLEQEKLKSDSLLLNILPEETANELKHYGRSATRKYKIASVLFTDFADFSRTSQTRPFEDIIEDLDFCFAAFDDIIEKYNIEKIKTMGDSYMCVGGIPKPDSSNPIEVVLAGLEMADFINTEKKRRNHAGAPFFEMRLGIHTGELIAGVVGKKKFAYDVWGQAVNLARRMESSGEIGEVNISQVTYSFIKRYFNCFSRGKIGIKHSGLVEMYLVKGLKPGYSANEAGTIPNEKLLAILEKLKIELPE